MKKAKMGAMSTARGSAGNMLKTKMPKKPRTQTFRRRRERAPAPVLSVSARVQPAGYEGCKIGKKSPRISWEREQGVQLSKDVLGFARSCSRLPDAGDRSFWQLCYKHFHGKFTCHQIQSKVKCLLIRFRQLASGTAKTLHLQERNIVQIWTLIMQHISPTTSKAASADRLEEDDDHGSISPACSSRSRPLPYLAPFDQHLDMHDDGVKQEAPHSAQPESVNVEEKNEVPEVQSLQPAWNRTSIDGHTKGATSFRKSALETFTASEREPAQEAISVCCSQANDDMGTENFTNFQHNVGKNSDTADKQYCGLNCAEATESSYKVQAALHQRTVADLASAVKTLAEVVACNVKARN